MANNNKTEEYCYKSEPQTAVIVPKTILKRPKTAEESATDNNTNSDRKKKKK